MRRVILLCIALWVVRISSNALAQTDGSVSVGLTPHKTELIIGEPLLLRGSYNNTGTNDILVFGYPNLSQIEISTSDTNFRRFYGKAYTVSSNPQPYKWKPGDTIEFQTTVLYHHKIENNLPMSGEYAFSQPGTYFVRDHYGANRSGNESSLTLQIGVRPPQGDDAAVWSEFKKIKVTYNQGEAEIFKLFSGMDAYGLLLQQSDVGVPSDALEKIAKLIQDHPASTYTPYVAFALGKHYRGKLMPGQEPAAKYLEVASRTNSPPILREEAMALWADALLNLSRRDKCAEVAQQFLTEFPGSQYKEQVQHLLARSKVVDPPSILENAVKELETQYEDVRGTIIKLPGEYFVAIAQLDDKAANSVITEEEMYTQWAVLLKSLIPKYAKPLSTNTNSPSATSATNSLLSTTNSPLPSTP